MSDVYVPGLKSRFNSEKIVDDLMKIERIPRERTERNIEDLESKKTWWRDLETRIKSLRESARTLFSFQNPFNERTVVSSNENAMTAVATREADEGEYQFSITQLAQADRFLSPALDEQMSLEAGPYTFRVGEQEVTLDFKGGTPREFADALNRRGRGIVSASLMTIQPGTRSLLLESKITGSENRLEFSGNAALLAESLRSVSAAQDAIISMEGIEMFRPSNTIDDVIPGVTITARGVSEKPERLQVQADYESIKDAIFTLVYHYNRLMAEVNVLTARSTPSGLGSSLDDSIIKELTYLTDEEAEAMRSRLGAFNGDSTLTQFRSNLMRAVSSSYPTDDDWSLSVLSQIGISTNQRGGGTGYNPAQLRGYLEVDSAVLDRALESNLPAIRQLFASSSTGDILADTGVAFNLDALSRPLVETGGIISLKTGTIDSKITQDRRRIDTMERQLAAKEADLKMQYSRMESAYARMEQMSASLDNFSQRNSSSSR